MDAICAGVFPWPEDHFGHSVAQRAMVIHLGESQIFEWKMAQAVDRVVGRKLAPADLLEKFADGFGVQESTQPSALSIQPTRV